MGKISHRILWNGWSSWSTNDWVWSQRRAIRPLRTQSGTLRGHKSPKYWKNRWSGTVLTRTYVLISLISICFHESSFDQSGLHESSVLAISIPLTLPVRYNCKSTTTWIRVDLAIFGELRVEIAAIPHLNRHFWATFVQSFWVGPWRDIADSIAPWTTVDPRWFPGDLQ